MNPEANPNQREQMEVRLVALLLGEASPFEEAELVKAMIEDPSLAAYYKEMRATIHLAKEASKQAPGDAQRPAQPIAQPKLAPERRQALLAKFKEPRRAAEPEAPPVMKPAPVIEAKKGEIIPLPKPERKPFWDSMVFRLAALFIVLGVLASLLLPALSRAKSYRIANASINNLQQTEGAKEQWARDLQNVEGGRADLLVLPKGGRDEGTEADEKRARDAVTTLGRSVTYSADGGVAHNLNLPTADKPTAGTTAEAPKGATTFARQRSATLGYAGGQGGDATPTPTTPPPPATVYLPKVEGESAFLGAVRLEDRLVAGVEVKSASEWDVSRPDGLTRGTDAFRFSADGKALATDGTAWHGWAEGAKPADAGTGHFQAGQSDFTGGNYRLNYGLSAGGEKLAKAEPGKPAAPGATLALGDYDNDGMVDLFINRGDGRFDTYGNGPGATPSGGQLWGGVVAGGAGGSGGYGGGGGGQGGGVAQGGPGGQPQSQLGLGFKAEDAWYNKIPQAAEGQKQNGLAVADNRAKARMNVFFSDSDFGERLGKDVKADPSRLAADDYVVTRGAIIDPASGKPVNTHAPALGDVPLAGTLFARGEEAGRKANERFDGEDQNGRQTTAGRYYAIATKESQPAMPGIQTAGGAMPSQPSGNGIAPISGPASVTRGFDRPMDEKLFDAPANLGAIAKDDLGVVTATVTANPMPATPPPVLTPEGLAPLPAKLPAPTLKGTPEDISGLVEKRNAEIAALANQQRLRENAERELEFKQAQLALAEKEAKRLASEKTVDLQRSMESATRERKKLEELAQRARAQEEYKLAARPAPTTPARPDVVDKEQAKAGDVVAVTGGTVSSLDKIEMRRVESEEEPLEARDKTVADLSDRAGADAEKFLKKTAESSLKREEQLLERLESARQPALEQAAKNLSKQTELTKELAEVRKEVEEKGKAEAEFIGVIGTNAAGPAFNLNTVNLKIAEPLDALVDSKSGKRDAAKEMKAKPALAPAENKPAEVATPAEPVAKPPPAPPLLHQPEVSSRDNAFSTFSLNVSDVAFKTAAASLNAGAFPDPNSIRVEEFINAFNYRDPAPARGAKLAFAWERARYPFAHNRDVLRFAVQTAAQGREATRPLNLVVLLDNSGSMERPDRVQIVGESLKVLAEKLQPQDKISVVAFSRTPRLWVDGMAGGKPQDLLGRVGGLNPQGGTDLGAGLELAYQTAVKHFLPQGNNRVLLLTDGAANLGNLEPDALKQKVVAHRQKGIALDCFGVGWEGYNDDLLEVLTHNGDGRYSFLNDPEQAGPEFANQLAGALTVAASDVKSQVEFNPERVTQWRQVGYAKHQLKKEQFRDNTVDAAEIAASEQGNAMYVIQVNPQGSGPLGVVRVRYKVPATGEYVEQEWTLPYQSAVPALDQAAAPMRLATVAAAFGEWLARNPYAGEVNVNALANYLNGVPEFFGPDPRPKQLAQMVRQAAALGGNK